MKPAHSVVVACVVSAAACSVQSSPRSSSGNPGDDAGGDDGSTMMGQDDGGGTNPDAGAPDGQPTGDAAGDADAAPSICFKAVDVQSNGQNVCAITGDGTVYCWGDEDDSQFTPGATSDTPLPFVIAGFAGAKQLVLAMPTTQPWMENVNQQALCAIKGDGSLWCVGEGGMGITIPPNGNCPNGPCATTPTQVPGWQNLAQMAFGEMHGCAVFGDGSVQCWGVNQSGELGPGVPVDCTSYPCTIHPPAVVTGLAGAKQVALGRSVSCAVMGDGSVQCWGTNLTGELGQGTQDCLPHSTPAPVASVSGIQSIVATGTVEGNAFCALDGNGAVWCWGENSDGELGFMTPDGSCNDDCANASFACSVAYMPTQVSGVSKAVQLVVAGSDTCAVIADGSRVCWGGNSFGEFGVSGPLAMPTSVAAPMGVQRLTMGGLNACAALADGSVQCWGVDNSGQLGIGTSDGSNSCDDTGNSCPVHTPAPVVGSGCGH